MPRLELREVIIIPSRHSHVSHYEHREIKSIKTDYNYSAGYNRNFFVVHFTEDLGEPVMHCCKEHDTHASEHNIMEVRNNKVCIRNVNIRCKRSKHKSRKTPYRKYKYKSQHVIKRRAEFNRTFIKCCNPVEYLYARWNSNQKC